MAPRRQVFRRNEEAFPPSEGDASLGSAHSAYGRLGRSQEKTKFVDRERASAIMAEKNIDILVGTGFINYGYITGYFTHFGMDYPGPLADGTPLVRLAGLPQDASLSPFPDHLSG